MKSRRVIDYLIAAEEKASNIAALRNAASQRTDARDGS